MPTGLYPTPKGADFMQCLDKITKYKRNGFPPEALVHPEPVVRLAAYRNIGFNKTALDDEFHSIRYEANITLGWTRKAINDEMYYIQREARKHFKLPEIDIFVG